MGTFGLTIYFHFLLHLSSKLDRTQPVLEEMHHVLRRHFDRPSFVEAATLKFACTLNFIFVLYRADL